MIRINSSNKKTVARNLATVGLQCIGNFYCLIKRFVTGFPFEEISNRYTPLFMLDTEIIPFSIFPLAIS